LIEKTQQITTLKLSKANLKRLTLIKVNSDSKTLDDALDLILSNYEAQQPTIKVS